MFKESPEGQTHHQDDGCGMPEHNTTNQQNREENKTCCCISYERGITPCLCGCHSTIQSAAKEAREEVIEMIEKIELIHSDLAESDDYSSHDYIAYIAEEKARHTILTQLKQDK